MFFSCSSSCIKLVVTQARNAFTLALQFITGKVKWTTHPIINGNQTTLLYTLGQNIIVLINSINN